MGLVEGADEDTIPKMGGRRSNEKVVGRNEAALSAEGREQFSPPLGDLGTKVNNRDSCEEGINLSATTCCAGRRVGQLHTYQQLCVDDSRKDGRLIANGGKDPLPWG